ncbi:MAG: hypothetical protein ACLP4V_30345, partial [Methylocella sp.]
MAASLTTISRSSRTVFLSDIKSEHAARYAPMLPALMCRSITAMGSISPVLAQNGNLSLEIWLILK